MTAVVHVLVLAAATWLGGWIGLAAGALALGLLKPQRPAWWTGLAAALAWGLLLSATVMPGPLGRLLHRAGGVLGVPGWLFVLAMLGYAWALGWSAARVGRGVRVRG